MPVYFGKIVVSYIINDEQNIFLNTDLNSEKFFDTGSNDLLIKEKMFIDYELDKEESYNIYFIDESGQLRYKIPKGKIFDFSF